VKRVILRNKRERKIGEIDVDAIISVKKLRKVKKCSIVSANIWRAEVVRVDKKKIHGYCRTHDFRGNILLEEVRVSVSKEEIKEDLEEINPEKVLVRVGVLAENLNKQQMRALIAQLEVRRFRRGEIIMKEGDKGTGLFIFKNGRAQISEKGVQLGVLVPGDYFGENAMLNLEEPCEWSCTVTATTKVACLIAQQKMVRTVLKLAKGDRLFAESNTIGRPVVFSSYRGGKPTAADDNLKIKPRTKNQISFIMEAVKDNILFAELNETQSLAVIVRMHLEEVEAGIEVITQGDPNGTKFYVIAMGEFDIIKNGKSLYSFEAGRSFGGQALIHNAPRAATVKSIKKSTVWVIERAEFRDTVEKQERWARDKLKAFIQKLEVFKELPEKDLLTLCDTFSEKKYKAGSTITMQGERGDKFYVIKEGTGLMSKKNKRGKIIEREELTQGSYFGQLALIKNGTKQVTTVTSQTDIICLQLSKEDFDILLKPLGKRLTERAQKHDRIQLQTYLSASSHEGADDVKTDVWRVETAVTELKHLGILGKGAYGIVTLVEDPKTGSQYALKAIRKHEIIKNDQGAQIVSEKKIQESLETPFCVKLFRTYRDKFRIYLLLEACTGGNVFSLLRKRRIFKEDATRFFAACVIAAFDHMHSRNILYRDLKPENLVIDKTGYVKLTDFGFAKVVESRTTTVCGTPDYLAPEVIIGKGYGKSIDYWTLGVFIYECLKGVPPFYSKNDMDCYKKILRSAVVYPKFITQEAMLIMERLLEKNAMRRLGVRQEQVIFDQPFFTKKSAKWSWEEFLSLEMKAPFPPGRVVLKDSRKPRFKLFDEDIECKPQEFEKSF